MVGKFSIYINLLFFTVATLIAQQRLVQGIITDAKTELPISGANIYISPVQIGTTSDTEGYFSLQFKPEYEADTLIISYLGYDDFRIPVSGIKDRLVVELVPKIFELERSISVTADKTDLAKREVAHAINRIDVEEIDRLGSSEIGDLFKTMPSVRIEGNDLDGRTIQIRGSNPDEVNVYIDGVLINNLRYDNVADLTIIPTESIEELEVLKGGNLVLLGNGAFGGVVNIRTRKSFQNGVGLKIKAGSFDSHYILGDLNYAPTHNLVINYFGQFNRSAPQIEYYQDERYIDKSGNNSIKTEKQNHHLNLSYFSGEGQFNAKFMGYFFDYAKTGWQNKYDNFVIASSYQGTILGSKNIELAANYLLGDNTITRIRDDDQTYQSVYNSQRLNLRIAKFFNLNKTDFQFLTEYYHDELDNTSQILLPDISRKIYESNIFENRLAVAGVFAFKDTMKTNQFLAWNTYIGLRYDILANGRRDFTNSFGIQLSIKGNKWLLQPYGHYGKNVKYPTLIQNAYLKDNYDFYHEDSTDYRLEPEFNNSTEIGLNYFYEPLNAIYSRMEIGLALYRSTYYNKLLTRPFDTEISYAQQGRNVTDGIEFSVQIKQLIKLFSTGISLNKYKISDPYLYPYKPDENYSFNLGFNTPVGVFLQSVYFYEGESTAWYYNTEDQIQTEIISPFFDIDISAGYRFKVQNLLFSFQVSGYNILDSSGYKYYTLKKRFIQISLSCRY